MPSVEEWLNKSKYLQDMEYYSTVNKIEEKTCVLTWIEGRKPI